MRHRKYKPVECDVYAVLKRDWMNFREVLWELNGPRENTYPQETVRAALDYLCKRKVVETKRGKFPDNQNVASGMKPYRLTEVA